MRDTERLDWLERHSGQLRVFDPPSGDAWVWIVNASSNGQAEFDLEGYGGTLREAIDDAIANETSVLVHPIPDPLS